MQSNIDELAKAAVLADPQDLPALVSLQEAFDRLASELHEPDLEQLGEVVASASGLIEQIVLREIEDAESAFSRIHESIEYAQKVIDAVGGGNPIPVFAPASGADATRVGDIDMELLVAWLSTCSDSLGDIEGQVLQIESGGASEELLGGVRRCIHTLKGECGVLSLGVAQRVCHEAESLMDRTIGGGQSFPVDAILSLVDWMKSYLVVLEGDAHAGAPAHTDLLALLVESSEDEDPVAGEAGSESAGGDGETIGEVDAGSGEAVEFPPDLDLDENTNDFLCESREHIAAAEEALLSLENDFSDGELINTVFRAFHTIKGVAGFMHLEPIVDLAHNAEFLLDEARKGDLTLNSAYLDLILKSCDVMTQLIGVLDGGDAPTKGELGELIGRLKLASKGELGTGADTPQAQAPETPASESVPKVTENAPAAAGSGQPAAGVPEQAGKAASVVAKKKDSAARARTDQTVKVNTARLDNLVTMVGELVIAQQMVVQDENLRQIKDQRFERNIGHSSKIIRDLQEVAMSLRMVTLKGIFQKMARLVRDVSIKAGKDIQFVIEGEDTELDRNVVEEIGDPLVHMIRNSCDHGIEPAEERVAAGKAGTGKLTLRAYHQGGSIIIEVEDDGRGLDRDKILKKATERGIFSADRDPRDIPDNEIYNLIMMAGFSTADKVTDISGRGVGMDVVRRNIEALRGKVEISSTPGRGSTIRMALPLTMAIIDGMIVRVGTQRYVVPTLSIEQSYRPTADELHSVAGRGEMASVRGSLLPIYRLNRIFDLNEGVQEVSDALLIVLESNESRCCLLVDEILGQQQVVIKSLGQGINSIQGVSGGAILGDGRVALIVDVGGLINQATTIAA